MNITDLVNSDLKTMCVAFFNIVSEDENSNFIIKSEYRTSKWATIPLDENTTNINNNLLNQQTGLDFRIVRNGYHRAIIENNTGISLDQLYDDLYVRIEGYRNDARFTEDVLQSCFALRGSYDPTFGWYAVDLYDSNEDIDNYRLGVLNLIGNRNINPERDDRNKQIRIRLNDFSVQMRNMGSWNIYKHSKHPNGV